jgi:nucleotide-binding universal stress UspA family protein
VKIITFSDSKQEKESLNSYLTTHGIKTKIDQKPIDSEVTEYGQPMEIDKVIGDRIITLSKQEEFDLIVMGCFGHSRLGDAVLSGVTNQISRNTQIPVLMSR